MRFAYADPPYFGHAKKNYGSRHPEAAEWDKIETHLELIETLLCDFPDGWALSMNPSHILDFAHVLPKTVRLCSWQKSNPLPIHAEIWHSWEMVVVQGGRDAESTYRAKDSLRASHNSPRDMRGAKPDVFCDWILALLNYELGDDLVDVFPGLGSMEHAIRRRESRLL